MCDWENILVDSCDIGTANEPKSSVACTRSLISVHTEFKYLDVCPPQAAWDKDRK